MSPSPRMLGLGGLGLMLALGACAEMQSADAGDGSCGAADRQDWVGQRVDVLNDASLPDDTRVLFPTTPATMDYLPERLNIAVDPSDTITRVYCG
jgi:Peptidase inhibitor I78 family